MSFTYATRADVEDLAGLINAAYRAPGETPGWTDERQILEGPRVDVQNLLTDFDRGRFLIARSAGGRIAACVRITVDEDGAWYLSSIAVVPAGQGAGLGAALLRDVERRAAEAGAPRLRMTVIHLRDTLIAWYERRGYVRTGQTIAFPYDDPSVGRPLRDDLTLIVLEKTINHDLSRTGQTAVTA